jgi:hypothetical protein
MRFSALGPCDRGGFRRLDFPSSAVFCECGGPPPWSCRDVGSSHGGTLNPCCSPNSFGRRQSAFCAERSGRPSHRPWLEPWVCLWLERRDCVRNNSCWRRVTRPIIITAEGWRTASVDGQLGIGSWSRPVVNAWPFAVEFVGHELRISADMQLLTAFHHRDARLLPGKHANLLAHCFASFNAPRRRAPRGPRKNVETVCSR